DSFVTRPAHYGVMAAFAIGLAALSILLGVLRVDAQPGMDVSPGLEIVEGKKRALVPSIQPRGAQVVTWIVRADKPVKIEVKAETRNAWGDSRTIDLGGAR
ncbi:MAG: hypothetical protein R6X21_03630, partial [Candidatus Aminicenantes bacterium]